MPANLPCRFTSPEKQDQKYGLHTGIRRILLLCSLVPCASPSSLPRLCYPRRERVWFIGLITVVTLPCHSGCPSCSCHRLLLALRVFGNYWCNNIGRGPVIILTLCYINELSESSPAAEMEVYHLRAFFDVHAVRISLHVLGRSSFLHCLVSWSIDSPDAVQLVAEFLSFASSAAKTNRQGS